MFCGPSCDACRRPPPVIDECPRRRSLQPLTKHAYVAAYEEYVLELSIKACSKTRSKLPVPSTKWCCAGFVDTDHYSSLSFADGHIHWETLISKVLQVARPRDGVSYVYVVESIRLMECKKIRACQIQSVEI